MKTKKNKIAGLHLWELAIDKDGFLLWITTPNDEPAPALAKALEYARKAHPEVKVEGIRWRGTIDA
jgi:hypothetical protein